MAGCEKMSMWNKTWRNEIFNWLYYIRSIAVEWYLFRKEGFFLSGSQEYMVYYSHSTHKRNLEDNLYSLGIYKAFNIVKQKMYWRIILMCSECMWTYNERIWIYCQGVWRSGAIVATIFTLSCALSSPISTGCSDESLNLSIAVHMLYFFLYFLCFVCIRERKSLQSDS